MFDPQLKRLSVLFLMKEYITALQVPVKLVENVALYSFQFYAQN